MQVPPAVGYPRTRTIRPFDDHLADNLERLKAALTASYALERALGSGGMATGYLAEDLKHHRKVAVKMLPLLDSGISEERPWLLKHYPPTLVATHTYVNPIGAVLLGWLFAGEQIRPSIVASTALAIVAIGLVQRGEDSRSGERVERGTSVSSAGKRGR